MTGKRIAIAVIHGMGEHAKADVRASQVLTFARPLREGVLRYLPPSVAAGDLAWREIFWSDLIQPRQNVLVAALEAAEKPAVTVGMARRFILNSLGDAACYFPSDATDSVYRLVHARIARVLAELESDTGPRAPLLVFAHSLGGHMMSNFIWDTTRPASAIAPGFGRFGSLAGLATFGCNIPVFAAVHATIVPIEARRFAAPATLLPTWWRNYYSNPDPLSFPLRVMPGGYAALGTPGPGFEPAQLTDARIISGNPLTAWNPAAHAGYWTAEGLHRPLAGMVAEVHARL